MHQTVDNWHLPSAEVTARPGRFALLRSALRNVLPIAWFAVREAPARRADARSRDFFARDRAFTHATGTTDAAAFRFSLR